MEGRPLTDDDPRDELDALLGVPDGATVEYDDTPLLDADGPPPSRLHSQAHAEHPRDREAARVRYIELMRQHGYIVDADDPDAGPRSLPCGWTPGEEDDRG